jgi:hypothetical protein
VAIVGDYVVIRSNLIATAEEARRYYEERYAGLHRVMCRGTEVTLFFESGATHLYSEEKMPLPVGAVIVKRRIRPNVYEERVFSLDRAQLMDAVIPAICAFTFSLPGTGLKSRSSRLLHGPRLPDGRYMRVVLRPGTRGMWTCVSAYPIESAKWLVARQAKTAKFPP